MMTANGPAFAKPTARQASESTRMNSRKKAQKTQNKLGEERSFRCPGDP